MRGSRSSNPYSTLGGEGSSHPCRSSSFAGRQGREASEWSWAVFREQMVESTAGFRSSAPRESPWRDKAERRGKHRSQLRTEFEFILLLSPMLQSTETDRNEIGRLFVPSACTSTTRRSTGSTSGNVAENTSGISRHFFSQRPGMPRRQLTGSGNSRTADARNCSPTTRANQYIH